MTVLRAMLVPKNGAARRRMLNRAATYSPALVQSLSEPSAAVGTTRDYDRNRSLACRAPEKGARVDRENMAAFRRAAGLK